ncbi:MAG: hypothetical protein JWO08_186 [Verrucomicrobiaceae bacterium]|nr:hypothetical protein [Verrucomicrobiaceae bacterium]
MKTLSFIALMMWGAFGGSNVEAEEVTLGDAVFATTSADADNKWYDPMRADAAKVFDGFGAMAGQTRTVTYSSGNQIAGVNAIKRHTVDSGSPAKTEDVWIAFDAEDNARVMKIVRAGNLVFVATAASTPPLFLPSAPTEGQSWEVGGTTATIEWVGVSSSGTKLKISYLDAGGGSHSDLLEAGRGVHTTDCGEESGWRLRPVESAQ